jgi:capsular exopolysaccharide synthesis family protein
MAEDTGQQEKFEDKKQMLEDRKIAFLTTLEVVKTKKHFFVLTVILTLFGTFLGHYLKVSTYQTSSSLFVQNIDQPSAAEYLLNQHVYKLSRVDRIDSYVNHLKSDSFYLKIAESIKFGKDFDRLNLTAPSKKSKLGMQYWKSRLFKKEAETTSKFREKKLLIPIENVANFLKKTVQYKTDYNSQFIQVIVTTLDPLTSQTIANLIVKEFVVITNQLSINEIVDIEKFVQKKKALTEADVKKFDQELIRFKQKNNIISADATTKSYAERLSSLESQIAAAKLQLDENNKLLKFFSRDRSRALKNIFKEGSKTEGFGQLETSVLLQNKIDQLKRQKSAFIAQGYQEQDWQIQKVNQEIDSNVSRLRKIVNNPSKAIENIDPGKAQEKMQELSAQKRIIKTRIATLEAARKDLQTQVNLMPGLQQQYIKLENQFNLAVENLAGLERKEKELEIQRISHKKEVRVDQLAQLPGPTPKGSLPLKLLFSSLAALFLGIVIVMGLESLDPSVKRRQDLYDCGLDFFGEVPYVENKKIPKKRKGRFEFGSPDDLVCKNNPESIESMSFKYMRARIESMKYKDKRSSQVITISSALHNEGKSFVTSNLAISLSQLKRKVILIDADLRRPSISTYFGLSSRSGLVDLLSMKKDLSEVLETEAYPNLHILPAGFSGNDSTELISSQKFRLLLEYLRNEYEYIVIDTPPTFAVVDAAIISSFSDIPILVSSFRSTRKADLYEAYNDLLQVSYKKVFGIINKAIVSNSRIHYYGYPMYTNRTDIASFSNEADKETQEFLEKLGKKTS